MAPLYYRKGYINREVSKNIRRETWEAALPERVFESPYTQGDQSRQLACRLRQSTCICSEEASLNDVVFGRLNNFMS